MVYCFPTGFCPRELLLRLLLPYGTYYDVCVLLRTHIRTGAQEADSNVCHFKSIVQTHRICSLTECVPHNNRYARGRQQHLMLQSCRAGHGS